MKYAVLLIFPFLFGCATDQWGSKVTPGAAVYSYTKTADGCDIRITSAREVAGGNVLIDDSCSLTVEAEKVDGAGGWSSIIGALINRIPGGQ